MPDNRNPNCPSNPDRNLPGLQADIEEAKVCLECPYGSYSNGMIYCTFNYSANKGGKNNV